jgi:hypothetical protein
MGHGACQRRMAACARESGQIGEGRHCICGLLWCARNFHAFAASVDPGRTSQNQAALHAILDRWPTSGPADYERRDQRSTKTPRRIRRQSPAHSVGSISAHEALVVEPPRAFFRAANRRPGVKWAIGPIAANGVRWGWLKLEEAQQSTLDDSRRRERKQRVVNGLVKCGASFGFEKHLHQRPKIPIVIVAHP